MSATPAVPDSPAWGGARNRLRSVASVLLIGVLTLAITFASGRGHDTWTGGASRAMAASAPLSYWKLSFSDDFLGDSLDTTKWHAYDGPPKGGPGAWDSSLVSVHDGKLVLRSEKVDGQWLTAGLSSARAGSQAYGKWDVRFRIDGGNGIGYALLLYPASGGWPPEIDFAEDGGGPRQSTTASFHWGDANSQVHSSIKVDLTQWHTMGVIIQPGLLQYTLDGTVWATASNANVPDEPMWLGMQTQLKNCQAQYPGTCMDDSQTGPIDLEVDYVARWTLTSLDVS